MILSRFAESASRLWRDGGIFLLASLATLTLVIAVNAAVFALVNQLLLSPLPFPGADRIVVVKPLIRIEADTYESAFSEQEFDTVAGEAGRDVEAVAGFQLSDLVLRREGVARRHGAMLVEQGLVELLAPGLSRGSWSGFTGDAAGDVVVVSHRFWQRDLAGREDVLSLDLDVAGRSLRVVGVLAPGTRAPVAGSVNNPDLWVPGRAVRSEGHGFIDVLARLPTGAGTGPLRDRIDALLAASREGQAPVHHAGVVVEPLGKVLTGWAQTTLWLMQGVGLLVFVVAMGNLASAFLLRCEDRGRELALHMTQGAGPVDVFWLLSAELVLVCVLSAATGLGLAALILPLLQEGLLEGLPVGELGLDSGSAFTVILVTVLGGLAVAALQVVRVGRSEPRFLASEGGASTSGRGVSATQAIFIGAQAAVSVGVLVTAVVLGAHLSRLAEVDPGYARDVQVVRIETTRQDGFTPADVDGLREALASNGVPGFGLASNAPLGGIVAKATFNLPGGDGQPRAANLVHADAGYFEVLGIRLLRGRTLASADLQGGRRVAVVNEAFARQAGGDGDILDRRIGVVGSEDAFDVVGIVAEVNSIHPMSPEGATVYLPHEAGAAPRVFVLARASRGQVERALRQAPGMSGHLLVADHASLGERQRAMLAHHRGFADALALATGVALVLCVIGLVGATTSLQARRRRELNLRLLLGAGVRDLARVVALRVLWPSMLGVLAGILLGFAGTRALGHVVLGLSQAPAWLPVLVAMAAMALLALVVLIPVAVFAARGRIDPA